MRALLSAILLAVISGCDKPEAPIGSQVSVHLERLEQLEHCDRSADRDEWFARLAEDSCGDGLPDLTHIALSRIENDTLRDTVALECALLMEKGGTRKHASQLARSIRDSEVRHTVLRQVRLARRK